MANIAQTINVLQALILTDGEKLIKTPTYHVFDLYRAHHDATSVPLSITTGACGDEGEHFNQVNGSASFDTSGTVYVTLCNLHPYNAEEVYGEVRGVSTGSVAGTLLTAPAMQSHNTFEQPDTVKLQEFPDVTLEENEWRTQLPARSVVLIAFRTDRKKAG